MLAHIGRFSFVRSPSWVGNGAYHWMLPLPLLS